MLVCSSWTHIKLDFAGHAKLLNGLDAFLGVHFWNVGSKRPARERCTLKTSTVLMRANEAAVAAVPKILTLANTLGCRWSRTPLLRPQYVYLHLQQQQQEAWYPQQGFDQVSNKIANEIPAPIFTQHCSHQLYVRKGKRFCGISWQKEALPRPKTL